MMNRAHRFKIRLILMIDTSKEIVIVTVMETGKETDPKKIEKHQCTLVIKETGSWRDDQINGRRGAGCWI